MLHSLLFKTFSSLGEHALALDCFLSHLFDLSLSSSLLEYSSTLTKVHSFSLSLGHFIHNTNFNYQIMSQAQPSTPPPLLRKTLNVFALTMNEIRLFTKANKDPPDLIAASFTLCLMIYPPDLCSSFSSRQAGIYTFEHTNLRACALALRPSRKDLPSPFAI